MGSINQQTYPQRVPQPYGVSSALVQAGYNARAPCASATFFWCFMGSII